MLRRMSVDALYGFGAKKITPCPVITQSGVWVISNASMVFSHLRVFVAPLGSVLVQGANKCHMSGRSANLPQGTAVVTSRDTSTEEVAGGAAVLVDPFDVDSIAAGLVEAIDRRIELAPPGRRRAGELSWAIAADRTLAVYREVVA